MGYFLIKINILEPSGCGCKNVIRQDSQHKIRCSTDSRSHSKLASCPHHRSRFPTWDHKTQKRIGWTTSTCWWRSWQHRHTSKNGPIGIQPCYHTHPKSPAQQFHKPNTTTTIWSLLPLGWSYHGQSMAYRTHATYLGSQSLQQMAQRPANIRTKAQGSYREHHQDRDLVVTPTCWSSWNRRTCGSHDGHPSQLAGQKLWGTSPSSCHDGRHQPHQLTSPPASTKAKAQGASIPFAHSPLDDSDHLYFDTLHHDSQHSSFSRLSHHPNPNDGTRRNPRSSTQSEAEVNFGRMYQSHPSLGIHTPRSQPFFQTVFTIPECLHSFHSYHEHAAKVLCWVRHASHHHTLDREYSRSRKYLPLNNERLAQAELALRYRQEHDNLYIWARIPIYTERADYRCLELALIKEWQPRLNYPFICQFFHPRKGILKKPALNTNAQFGLATLWRRAKHKFTPQLVKDILASDRFQNRLELWTIIHALGSNTRARFEQTKMLRSHEGGLNLCNTLRRLANNIQEPFRTPSLQAIDTSIKRWQGKLAPRASALRSPWSLTTNLQRQLKQFLRKRHLQVLSYQVPCHNPSFKMVFIKHAAVLNQLCNHM